MSNTPTITCRKCQRPESDAGVLNTLRLCEDCHRVLPWQPFGGGFTRVVDGVTQIVSPTGRWELVRGPVVAVGREAGALEAMTKVDEVMDRNRAVFCGAFIR